MDARLFSAVPGEIGSISYDKNITLDTEAPYVRSVEVTSGDGVYGMSWKDVVGSPLPRFDVMIYSSCPLFT